MAGKKMARMETMTRMKKRRGRRRKRRRRGSTIAMKKGTL